MHAVLTFNRLDIPTIEHQVVVRKVRSIASTVKGTPHVFLTHTPDAPTSFKHKIVNTRRLFGNIVHPIALHHIGDAMKHLYKQGYTDVTVVAGDDKVKEYKDNLNTRNGKDFKFNSINVVSSGYRVSEGGYKRMRTAAQKNDSNKFKAELPPVMQKHSDKLMTMVRRGLKLEQTMNEAYEEGTDKTRRAFIAATPGQQDAVKRAKKLMKFRVFYEEARKLCSKVEA